MRRWTQRQGECEQALGSKKHAPVKKSPIETTKLKPCMIIFREFVVNAVFCFGKLSTARKAFEFRARASAPGVDSLPFILKPNSCLLANFRPRICKDGV